MDKTVAEIPCLRKTKNIGVWSRRFLNASKAVWVMISRIFYLFLIVIIFIRLGGLGLAEVAYCAGASSSEIGPVLTSSAFPQFMGLPAEDCRSILFSSWQDLEQMVETCKLGRLPGAADCYELVLQLQPIQLENIITSIELRPPIVSEAAIQEWARISVELKSSAGRLLNLFEQDLYPGLLLVTGTTSIMPSALEDALQQILQLPLPLEVQSHYAAQILHGAQPLIEVYRALFELLPSNPEILYVEKEPAGINIYISQSEAEAIILDNLRLRHRQTDRIAWRFYTLRQQIRRGMKRQRGV